MNIEVTKIAIQGGKKIEIKKPKYEFVSSHTARRSFATNEYKLRNLTTREIMSITGHKTEKSFYKYIRETPRDTSSGNRACSYEGRSVKTIGANDGGVTKTADQGNPETKSAALDSIFVLGPDSNAADKTRHTASTARPRRLAGCFTTLTVQTGRTHASVIYRGVSGNRHS